MSEGDSPPPTPLRKRTKARPLPPGPPGAAPIVRRPSLPARTSPLPPPPSGDSPPPPPRKRSIAAVGAALPGSNGVNSTPSSPLTPRRGSLPARPTSTSSGSGMSPTLPPPPPEKGVPETPFSKATLPPPPQAGLSPTPQRKASLPPPPPGKGVSPTPSGTLPPPPPGKGVSPAPSGTLPLPPPNPSSTDSTSASVTPSLPPPPTEKGVTPTPSDNPALPVPPPNPSSTGSTGAALPPPPPSLVKGVSPTPSPPTSAALPPPLSSVKRSSDAKPAAGAPPPPPPSRNARSHSLAGGLVPIGYTDKRESGGESKAPTSPKITAMNGPRGRSATVGSPIKKPLPSLPPLPSPPAGKAPHTPPAQKGVNSDEKGVQGENGGKFETIKDVDAFAAAIAVMDFSALEQFEPDYANMSVEELEAKLAVAAQERERMLSEMREDGLELDASGNVVAAENGSRDLGGDDDVILVEEDDDFLFDGDVVLEQAPEPAETQPARVRKKSINLGTRRPSMPNVKALFNRQRTGSAAPAPEYDFSAR